MSSQGLDKSSIRMEADKKMIDPKEFGEDDDDIPKKMRKTTTITFNIFDHLGIDGINSLVDEKTYKVTTSPPTDIQYTFLSISKGGTVRARANFEQESVIK